MCVLSQTLHGTRSKMDSFKPKEALSLQGIPNENWRRWIQRFDLYLTASGKLEEDKKSLVRDPSSRDR